MMQHYYRKMKRKERLLILSKLKKKERDRNDEIVGICDEIQLIEQVEKCKADDRLRKNFKLSKDHIRLLKHVEFRHLGYGDLVYIGVEGKHPFGNTDIVKDVYRILGWKYPDEEKMSVAKWDREAERAWNKTDKLMKELPLAVNAIIRKAKL